MFCSSLPLNTAASWYGNKIVNLNKCLQEKALSSLPFKIAKGFVINNLGFMNFINNNINKIDTSLKRCDYTNINSIKNISDEIVDALIESKYSGNLEREIIEYFNNIEKPVIVRSSSLLEDSKQFSYAGVFDSFTDISNDSQVLEAIKNVYIGSFSQRALAYYAGYTIPKMNILVQEMVRSDISGICFTQHPDKSDDCSYFSLLRGPLVSLASGKICPEAICSIYDASTFDYKSIPELKGRQDIAYRVYEVSKNLEKEFGYPLDIEWGIQDDELYIFQIRPITKQPVEYIKKLEAFDVSEKKPLLEGVAIPPRQIPYSTIGKVSILKSPDDSFKENSILVTHDTSPDWEILMHKSRGIITDHGCRTSHAAIVAREIGLPAIVGTLKATEKLKDGQEVVLYFDNPEYGVVYNNDKGGN